MEDVTEIAIRELEKKAKSLKWEAEKAIDQKVESIKGQLKILSELKVPSDMLELYLKHNGKLWVSKRLAIGCSDFTLFVGGRNILYPDSNSREPEFKLPVGLYRLVLIALPIDKSSELGDSAIYDDYGIRIET